VIEKLIDWICRTPTRLGLVALTLMTLMVGGGMLWGSDGLDAPLRPAEPAPVPVTAQAAMDTANAFVASWCELAGRTPQQWADDMRARSTPELAKQWAPAMASALTGDCPWLRSDVRQLGATSALVAVIPKSTNVLLVAVVQDSGRLAVSEFDREGSTGLVGDV
jgi:hypothetical protein